MAEMNDIQIASACVFPRLNLDTYLTDTKYQDIIHSLIEKGVGGLCVFGKVKIDDAEKIIRSLQNLANEKLLFAADFEHGLPMRFLEGTAFPHAMALGKTGDFASAFYAAQLIGMESKEIGIDWIFAPVCDINSNPENPIINIRSFGEDPDLVGNFAAAYAKGLEEIGVINCGKHFPGHGDTNVDSHLALPTLDFDVERLVKIELEPFKKIIKNGIRSIMIGHLSVPAYDNSNLTASLSKKIVQDLLIDELGFDGIVISDALEMKAISEHYSSGEASELSLRAGNHIALIPENPDEAIEHLVRVIKNDNDFKQKLISNIEKINVHKNWAKNKKLQIPDKKRSDRFLQHEKFALQIARKSIEISAPKILTPLPEDIQIAAFAFLQSDHSFSQASMFFNLLQSATEVDIDFAFINEDIEERDLMGLMEGIVDAELIVFANFYRAEAYNGGIGSGQKISEIQKRIAGSRDILNIYFGNPYLSKSIDSQMEIKAFSDSLCSLAASVMILTGKSLDEENQQDNFKTSSN